MKQTAVALLLVLCFAFSGCEKDYSYEDGNKTKIVGKWMFVLLKINKDTVITKDQPCFADNYIEFREGGTGNISQGDCMESPNLPRDEAFEWTFTAPDRMDLGGDKVEIVKLTESELQIKRITDSASSSYSEYHWQK